MVIGGKEVKPPIIVPVNRFMCEQFLNFFVNLFLSVLPFHSVCMFWDFVLYVKLKLEGSLTREKEFID
jgi:hypothetical protein